MAARIEEKWNVLIPCIANKKKWRNSNRTVTEWSNFVSNHSKRLASPLKLQITSTPQIPGLN